ncbi:ABC transporter substrate-binding protein [Salinisphaera sp. Q1T1-3]|uniref:ABC transporter substrate-binding protein n=1 Tax=Salinisphaera sp. Q1T1-3 TaxID=2321229 RepID=UPI000E71CCDC|nr:ABC transporter substrate-binding protein [Salinisphaera sp. Q1T1-3]RJS93155.1 ABC transporter substrate-binding protein [Salinisphaera sp. Q1T1-3]
MKRFPMRAMLCSAVLLTVGLFASAASAASGKPLVIGSTNFPEQLILANIYADVLQKRGIAVKKRLNLGSREVVFPALKSGELDLLPEYSGALVGFLTNGKSKASDQKAVMNTLREKLPTSLVALTPSPAQDKDGLVVTPATAKKYDLETISDLAPVAGKLVLGGPPETKTRYVGVPGLKKVYGIDFKRFRSLDAGGPLTQAALASGQVDVARMFTTQGVISDRGWILLKDDKNLVPAQNIVPVARKAVLSDAIRDALNAVSAKLTTAELQRMNKRVSVDHDDPETVARAWVKQHKIGQ